MDFMCLPLTAPSGNPVTKLSCSTIKCSTVSMKNSFHWKKLHLVLEINYLSDIGGKPPPIRAI